MTRLIAISNQKGGVGKTTTAINLGASLASLNHRTLIIDMDPQGNSTSGVGVSKEDLNRSTYSVLLGLCSASDAIVDTGIPNLSVIPSNRELVGAEIELMDMHEREYRLKQSLLGLKGEFEYILIDCPPALGLLTINALSSAHSVLIPLQCEYFALEGLGELVRTLQLVKGSLNPSLEREGILLTMVDKRYRLSQQVSAEVRKLFGGLVFETVIPRNVRLSESPSFGKPVLLYDARSSGADSYLALARELIGRGQPSA